MKPMKLEWQEEHPNFHVARLHFSSVGVDIEAVARVFLVTDGYAVEAGIGAKVQAGGGGLGFDEAKDMALRMLGHQLQTLQVQIQGALSGSEASFGEVKPDGG